MTIEEEIFHEPGYLAINKARLDHLASLGLPLENRSVLELGAGIGDLTTFFVSRDCFVVITDGRKSNVSAIAGKYPVCSVRHLDVESPAGFDMQFDVVFCYGLLYHTKNPMAAIANMAAWCDDVLLLETCVCTNKFTDFALAVENENDPRDSINGVGCRLSREFVYRELHRHFDHVYLPVTQPDHPDFPLDWDNPPPGNLHRAIFIASRNRLNNALLTDEIPMKQRI